MKTKLSDQIKCRDLQIKQIAVLSLTLLLKPFYTEMKIKLNIPACIRHIHGIFYIFKNMSRHITVQLLSPACTEDMTLLS